MCNVLNPDFRNNMCTFNFIGNVHCPDKAYSWKICDRKKSFQCLNRSACWYPQGIFLCQGIKILFRDQANSFPLMCNPGVYIFEEMQKSIPENIRDVFCPEVFLISSPETSNSCDCTTCKDCCYVLNLPFKEQKSILEFLEEVVCFAFSKKTSCDYEKRSDCYTKSPPTTINYTRD